MTPPWAYQLCMPLLLFAYVYSMRLEAFADGSSTTAVAKTLDTIPLCHPSSRLQGGFARTSAGDPGNHRIVVVGDVHGDLAGMLEDLYTANITTALGSCEWSVAANTNTLLVQMGDIVDRGPLATEAYACLQHLQATAPAGCKVVRLLGNHELWWLEGSVHMRNEEADTPAKIRALNAHMKKDIAGGLLVGAFAFTAHGVTLLFTHAGLRPQMITHVEADIRPSLAAGDIVSGDAIALYINTKLQRAIIRCSGSPNALCDFADPIFQAGPERGGRELGGPFWTDFKVLQKAATDGTFPEADASRGSYVQIVGHSVQVGRIRSTKHAEAICVDAGMYIGGRAFLVVGEGDGRFVGYEKVSSGDVTEPADVWRERDITREVCNQ